MCGGRGGDVVRAARLGPRATGRGDRLFSVRPEDPDPESRPRPLSRWCRGVYRGRVEFEDEDGEVTDIVARFRFRVR